MPGDFDDRLRRALRNRAAQVTPDPATWRKVEARMQRERTFRLALSGGAVAAVLLIAVVTLPQFVRTRVDITAAPAAPSVAAPEAAGEAGRAADQPATLAAPDEPAGFCGPSAAAIVLASPSGTLSLSCADGGVAELAPGPRDAQPVFADPTQVVFSRNGTMVLADLQLRQFRELGPGTWPAVGPDGQLAAIVDEPGDGQQPRIVVRASLDGPVVADFAVFGPAAEEFTARHLTFVDGSRLAWEAGYEGSQVWVAGADGSDPAPLEVASEGTLAAPSGDGAGELVAVHRCCRATEGDRPSAATLVAVDGTAVRELLDLGTVAGFDVSAPDLFVARGDGGLLVGDGQRLFRHDPGSGTQLVSGDAASAAVPAAAGTTVQVFLAPAGGNACGETVAVPRRVRPPAVLRGALEQLLAGPTAEERARGLGGMFSDETSGFLTDVRLDSAGVAHVDFRDLRQVIPNASSSCGSATLLAQLDDTVRQFATVTGVRYSINGDEPAFYEWLQRSPP